MNRIWLKFQVWWYRQVRNNMVHRMRANGMSWTQINKVLVSTGQKQIIRIEHTDKGPVLDFGELELKPSMKKIKGKWRPVQEFEKPKVTDRRTEYNYQD